MGLHRQPLERNKLIMEAKVLLEALKKMQNAWITCEANVEVGRYILTSVNHH